MAALAATYIIIINLKLSTMKNEDIIIKDKCQSIRNSIRTSKERIREAEEVLPELHGPGKKVLEDFIKREKLHLSQLRNALKACEAKK